MKTPTTRVAFTAPASKTETAVGAVLGTLLTAVMVKIAYNNVKAILAKEEPETTPLIVETTQEEI